MATSKKDEPAKNDEPTAPALKPVAMAPAPAKKSEPALPAEKPALRKRFEQKLSATQWAKSAGLRQDQSAGFVVYAKYNCKGLHPSEKWATAYSEFMKREVK